MKIVVIEAWGLHLGYIGCYGNDWVATPNLDRLATQGIVFDWHIADQPELTPVTPWSERSVGTGCYAMPGSPRLERGATMEPRVVSCGKLTTFADDAMKAIDAGEPWLWIEGPRLLPPWKLADELLAAYFDEEDAEDGLTAWIDPPLDVVKLNDAEVLELQSTYAAVVTAFDAQLGLVMQQMRRDETLICVTARSGLPLGEHGMIGTPKPKLHDELVHVPLLMRLPSAAEAGHRIAALTQPIDLLPTFLETLSQPIPPLHGKSLWPLIRGEVEAIRPYAVASMQVNDEESRLLRSPAWAFHLPSVGAPQLFVKPADRWEVNDLYQQRIESADLIEKALRDFGAAIQCVGELGHPPLDL